MADDTTTGRIGNQGSDDSALKGPEKAKETAQDASPFAHLSEDVGGLHVSGADAFFEHQTAYFFQDTVENAESFVSAAFQIDGDALERLGIHADGSVVFGDGETLGARVKWDPVSGYLVWDQPNNPEWGTGFAFQPTGLDFPVLVIDGQVGIVSFGDGAGVPDVASGRFDGAFSVTDDTTDGATPGSMLYPDGSIYSTNKKDFSGSYTGLEHDGVVLVNGGGTCTLKTNVAGDLVVNGTIVTLP